MQSEILSMNFFWCTLTLKSIGHLAFFWVALLPTNNLGNVPSLNYTEFPNTDISYNIKKSHSINFTTGLIKKVSDKEVFENSHFCLKAWILSLAIVTDSVCSISRKCPLNIQVWITTVYPSVVLSSKNDDPYSWFSSNTLVHFLKTVTVLWYPAARLQGSLAFHHSKY